MSIALQLTSPAGPVHLEEEIEVVGLGIQDPVGKDFDQITK